MNRLHHWNTRLLALAVVVLAIVLGFMLSRTPSSELVNEIGQPTRISNRAATASQEQHHPNTPDQKQPDIPETASHSDLPAKSTPKESVAQESMRVFVSDDWTQNSTAQFAELVSVARENSRNLIQAFADLDGPQRFHHDGRRLIYALGLSGDPAAFDTLETVALESTSASAGSDLDHHGGPRREHLLTRGIALTSLRRIVDSNQHPSLIERFEHTLRYLVRSDPSPHIKYRAAAILVAHSRDPASELVRLESDLPHEFRYLLDVETHEAGVRQ